MIEDMETQLEALSEKSGERDHMARSPRRRRGDYSPRRQDRASPEIGSQSGNFRDALERIETHLKRVDHAIDGKAKDRRSARYDDVRDGSGRNARRGHHPLPARTPDLTNRAHRNGPEMDGLDPNQLQMQDERLNQLRDDVSALRGLIEEANFSGASDRMLNDIAALSGRIDTLTGIMSQTRQDPELMDAIRDIHALLDRPALDPSIDSHLDRILVKLDSLPVGNHFDDFAKLSAQMDNLRDILSAAPRAQQLSHMSGQMGMLVERLGALEEDVRRKPSAEASGTQSADLETRLANMQSMIERLDPNDRLMRVEDQLSALADQLEHNETGDDVRPPLEALARQVESLVGLMDQRDTDEQQTILETLATRVVELDRRIHDLQNNPSSDQRFDHVEMTLARIDDMLANRMESADMSALETGLSRIADRIEAQEQAFSNRPAPSADMSGLAKLEKQIADLADRLDGANRQEQGQEFYEVLTERLDSLATEFARSQSRFDAVDRLGQDIKQLADAGPVGALNEAKIAEDAAMKVLQQVGPLGAGSADGTIDAIIDGLKDDLTGLRKFAENSETNTQRSLTGVSTMLNTVVDRLGVLEEEIRNKEAVLSTHPPMAAPMDHRPSEEEAKPQPSRGLGKFLRRGRDKDQTPPPLEMAEDEGPQSLTAAELLSKRSARASHRDATSAQTVGDAPQSHPASDANAQDGRQPGIFLSGKAVSKTASEPQAPQGPQARSTDSSMGAAPQVMGNVALKSDPAPEAPAKRRMAQIVGGDGSGPARPTGEAGGNSKADFIAAARRAAQAAAHESQTVEKKDEEARGFLARFKGSKKKDQGPQEPVIEKTPETILDGANRKERRAAISEAARKAKRVKDQAVDARPDIIDEAADATLLDDLEDEAAQSSSLFGKIGGTIARHRRPLLMAAAAILLAITTLRLVQDPNSSLHGLFNSEPAPIDTNMIEQIPMNEGSVKEGFVLPADPEQQSNLTHPSGNLAPVANGQDPANVIAFAEPSVPASAMHGPRVIPGAPSATAPMTMAATEVPQMPSPTGDTAGISQGVDLTPTSSIPKVAEQNLAVDQPMPPILSAAPSDGIDPSVQAAVEMNKLLAPGVKDTPLMAAAKAGNAHAQFEMGRRLTLGTGVSVDMAEAAKWFEKAANQQMPQAQYSLANLYEKGKGVKQDLQVARLWYQRAAENGNIKAMHNLAVIYAEGGLGMPDFTQASRWFVRAADHGLKDSQYNLAILYARGMGVKQDLLQSYKWFAIAARHGDQGAISKRDEVLSVLNRSQQKTAKSLVENWTVKKAPPTANKLADIPDEWKIKAPEAVTASATQAKGISVGPEMIAKTQSMLGALGYNAGPADGQVGPRTRTAIRNFQEVAGLPVTGKIDAALLEALSLRVL